jgi:hypothetical protein
MDFLPKRKSEGILKDAILSICGHFRDLYDCVGYKCSPKGAINEGRALKY